MDRPIQYTPAVDRIVYEACCDLTEEEFVELAIAALDQAGAPAKVQEAVLAMARRTLPAKAKGPN